MKDMVKQWKIDTMTLHEISYSILGSKNLETCGGENLLGLFTSKWREGREAFGCLEY